MARTDTPPCAETDRTARDGAGMLTVLDGRESTDRTARAAHARPRAEFLTQLLLSLDPTMRASRAERMRDATDRYAAGIRLRA